MMMQNLHHHQSLINKLNLMMLEFNVHLVHVILHLYQDKLTLLYPLWVTESMGDGGGEGVTVRPYAR